MGSESELGGGARVYSEYQLSDGTGGSQTSSLLGARREWTVPHRGLKLLLKGELTELDSRGGGQTDRSAVALGVQYRRGGFKLSTRQELRRERGASEIDQWTSVNHLEVKVHPDYTVLGEYRVTLTEDTDAGGVESDADKLSVGLAYRPVRHDRLNGLFRYTQLNDAPTAFQIENGGEGGRKVDVLSAEWHYQLSRSWAWVGKQAYKRQRARIVTGDFSTETTLSIQRLNVEVGRGYYVGTEYRVLRQKQASDRRAGF